MFEPVGEFEIIAAAKKTDKEICGLQVGPNKYILMDNAAKEPKKYFCFFQDDMLKAYLQFGTAIIGVFHSHPNGRVTPSSTDLEFHTPGKNMIIIADRKIYNYGDPTGQDSLDSIPQNPGAVGNPYTL